MKIKRRSKNKLALLAVVLGLLDRKALTRWKHFEPMPLPESLERAFSKIERPPDPVGGCDAAHPPPTACDELTGALGNT